MTYIVALLLLAFVCLACGLNIVKHEITRTRNRKNCALSMECIPDGLSKKQALKAKEQEDLKKKNLGASWWVTSDPFFLASYS